MFDVCLVVLLYRFQKKNCCFNFGTTKLLLCSLVNVVVEKFFLCKHLRNYEKFIFLVFCAFLFFYFYFLMLLRSLPLSFFSNSIPPIYYYALSIFFSSCCLFSPTFLFWLLKKRLLFATFWFVLYNQLYLLLIFLCTCRTKQRSIQIVLVVDFLVGNVHQLFILYNVSVFSLLSFSRNGSIFLLCLFAADCFMEQN